MVLFIVPSQAQKRNNTGQQKTEEKKFTTVVSLPATPVKNQASTGTCWCFATTSFIESELLRLGKGEYDLSEMYIVRQNYIDKLKDNYLRQGKGNIGEGSLSHDWMKVFTEAGVVPEEVYSGINYNSKTHNHSELSSFIGAVAAVPVERREESSQYHQIINSILDIYLGKIPETFTYKGIQYTPKTFAESLGINTYDYIEITSFTHFPFYNRGLLEIPDNWRMDRFYNVPLNELVEIMEYSLKNGYSVNWDGDVSESGFSQSNGTAVVTDTVVTQGMRQSGYENFSTTDDHLMHITGIANDQNGIEYFVTKNSWGTEHNPYGGYINLSVNYVRAKTIFIMVNKNGIPQALRTKLGV